MIAQLAPLFASLASIACPQAHFPGEMILTSAPPTSVASADITGDGCPDAFAPLSGQAQALLYVPSGKYGFGQSVLQPLMFPSSSAVLQDINGDGRADFIVCATSAAFVETRLHSEDVTFRSPTLSALQAPADMGAVGDLNSDGVPDLVAVSSSGSFVQLGLGNSAGAFQFLAPIASGVGARRIALLDVDGDGFLEIATADAVAKTLTFFDAASAPAGLSFLSNATTSDTPYDLDAGQIDSDGRADLAIAVAGSEGVELRLSSLGAIPTVAPMLLHLGEATHSVRIALPYSSLPSFVYATTAGSRFWKYQHLWDTPFSKIPFEIGGKHTAFSLRSAIGALPLLYVACSDPPGLIAEAINLWGSPMDGYQYLLGFGVSDLETTDTNLDGRPDILASSRVYSGLPAPTSRIAVLLRTEYGYQYANLNQPSTTLGFSTCMATGDLDQDGVPDVVLDASHCVAQLLRGNGDGSLSVVNQIQPTGTPSPVPFPSEPAIADLTGDGLPDALIMNYQSSLKAYSGALSGGTPLGITVKSWEIPAGRFVLADADLDGDLDLYTSMLDQGTVRLDRWDGSGFVPSGIATVGSQNIADVEVLDFTKDGIPDVALSYGGSAQLESYASELFSIRGLADGLLAAPISMGLPTMSTCSALEATDLDGDGVPDLMAVNSESPFGEYPGSIVVAGIQPTGAATIVRVIVGASTMHDVEASDFLTCGRAGILLGSGGKGSHIWTLPNGIYYDTGNSIQGFGTPGCLGHIRMMGHESNAQGQPLRLTATQVASGFGLGLISDQSDSGSFDPFSMGLYLLVDPLNPHTFTVNFPAPVGGVSTLVLPPVPVNPALDNTRWRIQTIWVGDPKRGDTCSQATFDLQSSNLLTISL